MGRAKVITPSEIYQFRGQLKLSSFEQADVVYLPQQVARFAAFHDALFLTVALDDVFQTLVVDRYAARFRRPLEDLRKRCGRRWLDTGPVTHTSQERLVDQIAFIEVRGEYYELFERDLDLFTAVEGKKVYSPFQGKDPAIQEILRCDSLPAEVVDYERAAIGFHLEWGFVEFG